MCARLSKELIRFVASTLEASLLKVEQVKKAVQMHLADPPYEDDSSDPVSYVNDHMRTTTMPEENC